ncbi:hypothetical protein DFQ26_005672 [Actinomortierella ambigua]|nr:hypothetical protein DFQ26_005672 [Actinomortierella ambigua]
MDYVLIFSQGWDVGRYLRESDIDLYRVAVANLQNRGNCALDHYCRPNNTTDTFRPYGIDNARFSPFPGSLAGTCQPLLPANSVCFSSTSCQNWAGPSSSDELSLDASRTRCSFSDSVLTSRNYTQGGTCVPLGPYPSVYSWIRSDSDAPPGYNSMQKYLLLSSGVFLMLALLGYVRFKHQARERQRQAALRQQTTYRPPDPEDDGLPSYGQHTRDARVTGLAAEEIGMYGFPSDGPPDRQQQQQQQHQNPYGGFSMYYPPPQGSPPPHMTPTSSLPPPLDYFTATTASPATATATATVPTPSGTVTMDPLTVAALSSAAAAATAGQDTDDRATTMTTASTTAASSPQLSAMKAAKEEGKDDNDRGEQEAEGRPGSSRSLSTKRESLLAESPKGDEANSSSSSSSMAPGYSPSSSSPSSSSSGLGSVTTPPN